MNRVSPLLVVALAAWAMPALAYRSFDSTDADIAHAGEAEIELGPVHWLREGSKRFVHAPAVIANIGFSKDGELVIQGRHEVALDREPGEPRSALADNGAFIKQAIREHGATIPVGMGMGTVISPPAAARRRSPATTSSSRRRSTRC